MKKALFIICAVLAIFGCGGENVDALPCFSCEESQVSSDKENNISNYKTVVIGTQIWMAENLNYAVKGSVCYNCDRYGRKYDWPTAMGCNSSTSCSNQIQSPHQGICPDGWHIPSEVDWNILINYANGYWMAGTKLKAALSNGTDEYGFSALTDYGHWWGSRGGNNYASSWSVEYDSEGVHGWSGPMSSLYFVRCLQNSDNSVLNSSSSGGYLGSYGSIAYGGQTYKTVVIGTQTWMAENYCRSNCNTYGGLYNWSTAMDLPSICNSSDCSSQIQSPHQGICPDGWHIPSNVEWDRLYRYIDGSSGMESPYHSLTAGRYLKATSGWSSYNGVNGDGTDQYGFSALPGGNGSSDATSLEVGDGSNWWSANEYSSYGAYFRTIYCYGDDANWNIYSKSSPFSVRCVQDNPSSSSSSEPSSSSFSSSSSSSSSVPPSSSSVAPSSSSSPPVFACTMTATTGTVGVQISPTPTVTCNGTAVSSGLAWTPANLTPTAAGSVSVSVAVSGGVCSGMTAVCGSITVSPPTLTCTMTATAGTVGTAITPTPTVSCNGAAVSSGLAWTPSNLTPTAVGSVAVSVAVSGGICSGMTAVCGSITVSAPTLTCTMTATAGTVGTAITPTPTVSCNGTAVSSGLAWTPANLTPTVAGSVSVSVSASSGVCSGMTAACGSVSVSAPNYGPALNYEGQTYKTVVIGTQTWMAENLNYAVEGSKCYDNDPANCTKYGRMYNWVTAMNFPSSCNGDYCSDYDQIQSPHRGICPSGWHIPSNDDWDTLTIFVESNSGCSSCDARLLKATSGWSLYTGTDDYGFSALPGGYGHSGGSFIWIDSVGNWWGWSSVHYSHRRWMSNLSNSVSWQYVSNNNLFSVRCLKD